MGFNEIVFHRAAELLPNVDFFRTHAARENDARAAKTATDHHP
jgi:hypothetical protein